MRSIGVLVLLLAAGGGRAGEILVATAYIETPGFMRFAGTFQSSNVLALCARALVAQPAAVKVTGCESETCPDKRCAPAQCGSAGNAWREVTVTSACGARAFIRAMPGVAAGPVETASADDERNKSVGHIEGHRFRFADRNYLVRVTMLNERSPQSRARLEILRDGKPYAVLQEQAAHEMSCDVNGRPESRRRSGRGRIVFSQYLPAHAGRVRLSPGNARPLRFHQATRGRRQRLNTSALLNANTGSRRRRCAAETDGTGSNRGC